MPHETLTLGAFEVTALCDAAVRFPQPLTEAFPDVPADEWPGVRARYPDAADGEDGWLFHVHTYLVRSGSLTVLVDAGLGPAWTIASAWVGVEGRLPQELAAAGVSPDGIDVVVITHLHLDHIGWGLRDRDDPRPWFANASYVINRTEWEGFRELGDEDDIAAFEQQAVPLERAGVLRLIESEHTIAEGLTIVPTPGHTPGHQGLLLESGDHRALVSGDLTNHPVQVTEPRWRSSGDMDPALASWTRRAWLDRVEAEGMLLCTAHYPKPFARLGREHGRRYAFPAGAPSPP
jgi:glyoxylase-like metal-dependent hydrolase (beta-lactamase superfamily II)